MKRGDVFRTFRGTKNHVLKVFEEDGETFIVFKWWRRGKQRWEYEIEPEYVVQKLKEGVKQ